MMKKHMAKWAVSSVLLGITATSVLADEVPQQPSNQGMYVSVLWTPMVVGGDALPSKADNYTAGAFSYPYGFGGSLGYQFNRFVALEVTGWTAVRNFYNGAIDAKFILPLGHVVNAYAKLGGDVLSYKDVFSNTRSGGGPFAALGMGFRMTPRLELNVETNTYSWIRQNDFTAIGTAGLGLTYQF